MKAKMVIPITLTFFIVMIIIPSASAQSTIASIMGTVSNAQYNYATQAFEVPYGQMIELRVTVSVASDSPAPLDGFWITVVLTKPSGFELGKQFDFTNEYIGIGQSKSYWLKTGITADEVGTWKYKVYLLDRNKMHIIDSDSGTFNVVAPPSPTPTPPAYPKAEITVEQIAGYVTAIMGVMTAAYLAYRSKG